MNKRQRESQMRNAWYGRKAPNLDGKITNKFSVEVDLDSEYSVGAQEMANRHEREGCKVTREFFDREFPGTLPPRPFVRIVVEPAQLEVDFEN